MGSKLLQLQIVDMPNPKECLEALLENFKHVDESKLYRPVLTLDYVLC